MTLEEAAFGHRVVIHAMDWTLVLLDERIEDSFAEWMERRRLVVWWPVGNLHDDRCRLRQRV